MSKLLKVVNEPHRCPVELRNGKRCSRKATTLYMAGLGGSAVMVCRQHSDPISTGMLHSDATRKEGE